MISNQANNAQIDACMATPALFSEMIMQSHNGLLHILPALPTEWPEGEVKGLIARGGYKLNISWKYGKLTHLDLFIPKGKEIPKLMVNNQEIDHNETKVHIGYM